VLIHVVADFGPQDLAFAEVTQQLLLRLPQARVVPTPVPPFSTLAAGFVAAQLAAAPAPPGTLVFVNVAPRRDDPDRRVDNDGERLIWARLPSGTQVVGVDAGSAFAFVAEAAGELRALRCATRGSQFRSRDLFPEAVARVARGDAQVFGPPLAAADLARVPVGQAAYVDGFGNVKTSWRWGALPEGLAAGDRVRVRVRGRSLDGRVADGSFSVPEGVLAVAPGSSGYLRGDDERVRWVELFLRGGAAATALGGVAPGDGVELVRLDEAD
jgi:S-adenosylmethionine hydrolase